MIRWTYLISVIGFFVLGFSAALLCVLIFALLGGDSGTGPLLWAFLISVGLGVLGAFAFRSEPAELHHREGILLVILAWVLASILGSLPYYLSPYFDGFTNAMFESVSGLTTTGATILSDIEALPASLLLWRSLTQWLGGMGIILLGIAIMPLIGVGGKELYRAEFSGARSEKLKPRIAETALALWKIYVALTALETLALWWAGMHLFEAVCHSFTTMATGGFSTRNQSIRGFQSPAIEAIVILFMFLAGISFTLHYQLLVQRRVGRFFRDMEFRAYSIVILVATALILIPLVASEASWVSAIRFALFQVVSILTGTGYATADFEQWVPFSQLLILSLMFLGGCTGSTTGGLKMARVILLFRVVLREFRRMVERRGVFAVRLNTQAVGEDAIRGLLNLVYLAILINFAASLFLTAQGVDILTAISAVAASMFNIGPGLGEVGPLDNYEHIPLLSKWVLSFCMLAGRLEYYTLLVIATRWFWRK